VGPMSSKYQKLISQDLGSKASGVLLGFIIEEEK